MTWREGAVATSKAEATRHFLTLCAALHCMGLAEGQLPLLKTWFC